MIQLIPLIQAKTQEQTLKSLYHDSFPPNERRDWDELLSLTQHPHFNLYSINHENEEAGLITIWKWAQISFIEHFAVNKSLRGQGIGSKVLNLLLQNQTSSIFLETEEPNTESAIRRINFYTRLGFHICQEEYYQPPYAKDKKAVKMLLLSYPNKIGYSEFTAIRAKLYKEVYDKNITEIF